MNYFSVNVLIDNCKNNYCMTLQSKYSIHNVKNLLATTPRVSHTYKKIIAKYLYNQQHNDTDTLNSQITNNSVS